MIRAVEASHAEPHHGQPRRNALSLGPRLVRIFWIGPCAYALAGLMHALGAAAVYERHDQLAAQFRNGRGVAILALMEMASGATIGLVFGWFVATYELFARRRVLIPRYLAWTSATTFALSVALAEARFITDNPLYSQASGVLSALVPVVLLLWCMRPAELSRR